MSVRNVLVTGLAKALGTYLPSDLARDALGGAVQVLKDHFTLTGADLAEAFQDSLARGAGAIGLGISRDGAGALTRLGAGTRQALAPKIAQVYAQRIEGDYLRPYAQARGLAESQVEDLRRAALALCQELARRGPEVLPPQALDEADLAALARGSQRADLAGLLLGRAEQALGALDPQARGLLAHQGLLGDATLFFLRERLRTDSRVRATLDALQREGLWDQVRALEAARDGGGPLLRHPETAQAMAPLLDAGLGDLRQALGDLAAQVAAVGAKVDAVHDDLGAVGDQLTDVDDRVRRIETGIALLIRLVPQRSGPLDPRSASSVRSADDLETIRALWVEYRQIPQPPRVGLRASLP